MSSERTVEQLLDELKSADQERRLRAVAMLGKRDDGAGIGPLVEVLVHETGVLRFAAADALARSGPAAAEPLMQLLHHPDGEIRFWAARALGPIGDVRALPDLMRLRDTDTGTTSEGARVSQAAASAVRAIRRKSGADPWQLVEDRRYQEALAAYSALYAEDGRPSHLRNRGLVFLLLRDYSAALADFERAIEVQDQRFMGGDDYAFVGVCRWCLGRREQAVEAWTKGIGAPYADLMGIAGPLSLLFYAAWRTKDPDLPRDAERLARESPRHSSSRWEEEAISFLLGTGSAERLGTLVDDVKVEKLRMRWQCRIDFLVGAYALRSADEGGFKAGMARCASISQAILEYEYHLASWELERGFSALPF